MRNRIHIVMIYLTSVLLLVSCISSNGQNKDKIEQVISEVVPYKVISLEVNEDEEVSIEEIIIEDEAGNIITPSKLIQQENNIKVYPPKNGYKIGETYNLTSSKYSGIEKKFTVRKFKEEESRLKNLIRWGVGFELQEDVQNDRDYNWYIDQMRTGEHRNNNCGPASVTMAIKWADESFEKTAADARNAYREDGGWWYTTDISNYLKDNDIDFRVKPNITEEKMIEELNNGNILLLCMNTKYITRNRSNTQRTGRFYDYANGHFIIVKGYVKMDDNIFFTVYDPNNWNKKYKDSTNKGKDRYYKSQELNRSVVKWWDKFFVINNIETAAE